LRCCKKSRASDCGWEAYFQPIARSDPALSATAQYRLSNFGLVPGLDCADGSLMAVEFSPPLFRIYSGVTLPR